MRTADEVQHTFELVCGGVVTAGLTFGYILSAGRMLAPSAYGEFSAALSSCHQIFAFWFAHETIWSLIRALYLVQGSLLIVMLLLMPRLRGEGVRC